MKYILLYILAALTLQAAEPFVSFDKFKKVKIEATNIEGERIGKLKKGQFISLKYLKGEWTAYKTIGPDNWEKTSPDDTDRSNHRLAIKIEDKKEKLGFRILPISPQNTAEKKAIIEIEEDGVYYISIADLTYDANEGEVYYEVGVSKPIRD